MGEEAVGFGIIHKAVGSAQELAGLQGNALWALFSIILIAYIVYMLRNDKTTTAEWQRIRTEEAKADLLMAQAIQKMAEELSVMKVILTERLPRRGA